MAGITIESVTKRFGEATAVDAVSLTIEKGELFFLLGPSGCGKTTLLRLLAGFYFPDGGRILFDGQDITHVPPHRRDTGMVFQNYALWPHMSVRQNLAFGLEMRGVPQAERGERVERALDMVQLAQYGDRGANQLSGGQQQRVAVARALVLEPQVVLMDEPLSNLDARLRLEMRDHIKRLHERLGVTIVYVTHDQHEALSMADRMAIMRQGVIAQLGTPRHIYDRPASSFVADFIGETNMVEGTVLSISKGAGDEEIEVETAAGRLRSRVFPQDLATGQRVRCSIRPERLAVLTADEDRPNLLEGRLARSFFLGDHEQHFVRLGRDEWKVLQYERPANAPAPDEAVRLGCGPDDVVVLAESA